MDKNAGIDRLVEHLKYHELNTDRPIKAQHKKQFLTESQLTMLNIAVDWSETLMVCECLDRVIKRAEREERYYVCAKMMWLRDELQTMAVSATNTKYHTR